MLTAPPSPCPRGGSRDRAWQSNCQNHEGNLWLSGSWNPVPQSGPELCVFLGSLFAFLALPCAPGRHSLSTHLTLSLSLSLSLLDGKPWQHTGWWRRERSGDPACPALSCSGAGCALLSSSSSRISSSEASFLPCPLRSWGGKSSRGGQGALRPFHSLTSVAPLQILFHYKSLHKSKPSVSS